MSEPGGSPLPAPVDPPKSTSPWLITLAVVLIGCCSCFGVMGLLFTFGEPVLQALGMHSLLPLLANLH